MNIKKDWQTDKQQTDRGKDGERGRHTESGTGGQLEKNCETEIRLERQREKKTNNNGLWDGHTARPIQWQRMDMQEMRRPILVRQKR